MKEGYESLERSGEPTRMAEVIVWGARDLRGIEEIKGFSLFPLTTHDG
jgi:hypothetical protein